MKKTKCYSVRLDSLVQISEKAYKATAFDGSTAIIPVSQVFGPDYEISKSDAYWVSAWILEQKELQYSTKKVGWFDENGRRLPNYHVEKHVPGAKEAVPSNEIDELRK
jgi:hypothetical protein